MLRKMTFGISLFVTVSFCFAMTFASESIYYPGETVESSIGSYKVIEELGQGAFGCVYKVEDTDGTVYALKAYKADAPEDHIFGDPVREFGRGQILDHPHIVKSYSLFDTRSESEIDTTNLVLEFIEGKPLFRTAVRGFTQEEAFKATAQFVSAINYAFEAGYLHLDLHGGNIMIDNQRNLKLIDLGSFCSKEELLDWVTYESTYYSSYSYSYDTTYSRGIQKDNPRIRRFFEKNPELLKELVSRVSQRSTPNVDVLLTPIYIRYMRDVKNICVDVVLKSTLEREEKLDLLSQIVKIELGFQADRFDGHIEPVENYMSEMEQILKSVQIQN